jgi:hypothetical protein
MDKIKTTNQREEYELKKEHERKRRFNILSGNITPIETSYHLNDGEQAYFEFDTKRLANREYIESSNTGKARNPLIQGGLLRGNVKINTTITQERRTEKLETIDRGTMLFTNKQMIFLGNEVVSIPYSEIYSIDFDFLAMYPKYQGMLKGECYSLGYEPDVKFYYYGIMRKIGRDKSKIAINDVSMYDFPKFVPKKDKPIIRLKKMFASIGKFSSK